MAQRRKRKHHTEESQNPNPRHLRKTRKKVREIQSDRIKAFEIDIEPEIARSIFAILIFLSSALVLLSIIGLAGTFGEYLNKGLRLLFGWGMYIVPLLLIGFAFFIIRTKIEQYKNTNIAGVFLFLLSLFGLIHMSKTDLGLDAVRDGVGGGYAGLVLSYPLYFIVGQWAAYLIISSLFIISLVLTFDVSLSEIIAFTKKLVQKNREVLSGASVQGTDQKGMSVQGLKQSGFRILGGKQDQHAKINAREGLASGTISRSGAYSIGTSDPRDKGPSRSRINKNWKLPSLDLLDDTLGQPTSGDIKQNAKIIKQTLENFGISVEMGAVSIGPTVTQYTLRPAVGVKLNQILALQNDLALALAAHPLRIEAPIPGKSVVGIEVPNQSVAIVRLREILETKEFQKNKSPLSIALGRDVAGNPLIAELQKMPHMMIAGATGSGKSVCINTIILSLLYQNSPDDLKFILVDPKRVELTYYNNVPHLVTPVITETKKTVHALKWAVAEMDRRYKLLSESSKRDIESYNTTAKDRMPYIVIVIDELADLMSVAAVDVEAAIVRLAQMARAVGMHLIVATQRPSVDVITGLIKANITTRIAFNVASQIDSRTVIDSAGAEKLLGNGDMLYVTTDLSKPRRIQGAFVSEEDVSNVTKYLSKAGEPDYIEEVVEGKISIEAGGFAASMQGSVPGEGGEIDDDLFNEAKEVVVNAGKGSASLLQRRLRVGYARAARLLDLLEQEGVVGPPDGSRPREVMMKPEVVINPARTSMDQEDRQHQEPSSDDDGDSGQNITWG